MRLEPATPDEAMQRDLLSHEVWGGAHGVPEHVEREARLRAGWWPRQRMVCWLLREGDQVLASCEIYRVDCVVDGEPGVAWEIASVYVEPASRGQGHASRMLDALAAQVGAEPGARALVLFSDIGAALYERLGFAARPAWDRVVPAALGAASGPELFSETELASVRLPAVPGGFAISPSHAQLDWHLDRSRTRQQVASRRPDRCGARLGEDVIVWSDDGKQLLVLTLAASSPAHAAALLRAAADMAARCGLAEVRAWETPGIEWEGLARRAPRTGGLPMLRPLAPGVEATAWVSIPRGVWV